MPAAHCTGSSVSRAPWSSETSRCRGRSGSGLQEFRRNHPQVSAWQASHPSSCPEGGRLGSTWDLWTGFHPGCTADSTRPGRQAHQGQEGGAILDSGWRGPQPSFPQSQGQQSNPRAGSRAVAPPPHARLLPASSPGPCTSDLTSSRGDSPRGPGVTCGEKCTQNFGLFS